MTEAVFSEGSAAQCAEMACTNIYQPLRALGVLVVVLVGAACGEIGSDTSSSITLTPAKAPQATQVADRMLTQAAQPEPAKYTAEATIDCSIDYTSKRATCTVSEYDYETITWSSNASWATSGAGTWMFQLDEPTTDLLVQLEICGKAECRTIQASFDLPPELRDAHDSGSTPLSLLSLVGHSKLRTASLVYTEVPA